MILKVPNFSLKVPFFCPLPPVNASFMCSFKDKEVQRDAKMVPYKIIDKSTKPYVEVKVGGENKVIKVLKPHLMI